jgi:mevalonate kinase
MTTFRFDRNFSVEVPGKWILAGEHAVIRGTPALVFPLKTRSLILDFTHSDRDLSLQLAGEHGEELQLLIWGVLEKACELKKIHRADLRGQMTIQSSIPIGAGLGASAALCVAVSRWLQFFKVVDESEISEFARQLENLFHGESSGVDIAVALSGQGIKFVRGEKITDRTQVKMSWQPKWYVSYSGKRGVTLECVQKVKTLLSQNPELGQQIDNDMAQAVNLAEAALTQSEGAGFPQLKEAMNLANSCFERWGLTTPSHMNWLKEQGAIAMKPTGSGDGGYVLSLWNQLPSDEALKKLIPCF